MYGFHFIAKDIMCGNTQRRDVVFTNSFTYNFFQRAQIVVIWILLMAQKEVQ